jgi:acetyl-CoA synthetase
MPTLMKAACEFDFDAEVRRALQGDFLSLNACVECCDRHDQDKIALFCENESGESAQYTFGQLRIFSEKFAYALRERGIQPGQCVGGLLPRRLELLITILGTWRAGAVFQPLFTAFGPKSIEHRVTTANTQIVVTNAANRSKLNGITGCSIVTVGPGGEMSDGDFWAELNSAPEGFLPEILTGDDPLMMMFTSGTTGLAKPLRVPIKALAAFASYQRDAVGLRPDDKFWCIADPGWAYGLYFGIAGPLALGHAITFVDGKFTAQSCCDVIIKHGITNLIGAPTAYRMLMAAPPEITSALKGRLRAVSSAGEPLNPKVVRWFHEHLSAPIYDHYGQTEVGMVLCNHHGLEHPVRIGSAGFPSPGYRLLVLNEDHVELPAGIPGMLAIDRRASPFLWFSGYMGIETSSFVGDYYLTGDTVAMNADGSITFVARADDVITSSGYRIGPFDVESALIEHPAVADVAVVGKPDSERTEIVKAFVVLRGGHERSDALVKDLQRHVRERLSKHAYPREVEFLDVLPRTPSGKIQRFALRNGAQK